MANIQHQGYNRLREQHLIVSRILIGLVFVIKAYLGRPFSLKPALSLSQGIEGFLQPTGIGT
jgi:hypothetical protein